MKRILLAAASGLLYCLAFPNYDIWGLVFCFAVPLFFAIRDTSIRESFVYGFIAGFVARGGILYWLPYVGDTFGEMHLITSTALYFVLTCLLASYFGIFAVLSRLLLEKRFSFITIPGCWVLIEIITAHIPFGGFPWAQAGHPTIAWPQFAQLAEFGGVYLLSGIALMSCVAAYQTLLKRRKPLAVVLTILLAASIWGDRRMDNYEPQGETLRVAIAQANIAQEQKWLRSMIQPTIEIYSELSRQAAAQEAEMIIWPETACNFYLFRSPWEASIHITELNRELGLPMLVGSPAKNDGHYFNRMWLIENGAIEGYYDKKHLVPFGEYIPLAWLINPIFGNLTAAASNFTPSNDARPLGEIGILICFESLFADISRSYVKDGATYFVNASNDAWFKTWATPEQLLQMARFRSIENRRWTLRPVNHGISASITPTGEISQRLELLTQGIIIEDIVRNTKVSFYTRFGPVISILWGLIGLAAALTNFRRGARREA